MKLFSYGIRLLCTIKFRVFGFTEVTWPQLCLLYSFCLLSIIFFDLLCSCWPISSFMQHAYLKCPWYWCNGCESVMFRTCRRDLSWFIYTFYYAAPKMPSTVKSAGPVGFFGVSQTLRLGEDKKITHNKFHIVILFMFLTFKRGDHNISTSCLSISIALQRSNEVYRYIRYPYRRTQQPLNDNFKFTIFCIFYLATKRLSSLCYFTHFTKWRHSSKPWSRLSTVYQIPRQPPAPTVH